MLRGNMRIWVLLCLLLVAHVTIAEPTLTLARRQEDASPSPTPSPTPSGDDDTNNASESESSRSATPSASGISASRSSTASSVAPSGTASNTADASEPSRSAIFANPVPQGELPLQPKVTPGWGVAGVLMLLTGAVHTLIGIKNAYIHTFFSTAYLASLGTAVLIIYVMKPPIAVAVQGGYVAAVSLTGIVLGIAGTFFKEVTEGLGCALGGFCFGMWLLCLRPGGLLEPGSAAVIVLLACFTAGVFGLYFSRYTRDYALMGTIAFSGATVTVLGIDSFSRAGLKEMWVYMWDLNDDLFPLGTDTYPLTRGMEVELAATVIICIAGVISQMKLWRIIKERRAKKAADREEGQRNLEEEEENVGRQIMADNARERRQWERVYGDGEAQSTDGSSESGLTGGAEYEKKNQVDASGKSSQRHSAVQVQTIEMTDMSSSGRNSVSETGPQAAQEAALVEEKGMVTVRVAEDDTLPAPEGATRDPDEDRPSEASESRHNARAADRRQVRLSQDTNTTTPSPRVVPLPFTVPGSDPNNYGLEEERSSIATFADEGEEGTSSPKKRRSLANRVSQGSLDMLRRVSQRDSSLLRHETHQSQEDLVVPKAPREEDDGSIAATMDVESMDGDRMSQGGYSRHSIEITAELADKDESSAAQHESTNTTDALNSKDLKSAEPKDQESLAPARQSSSVTATSAAHDATPADASAETSVKAKSVLSADSASASLTKERLPNALSRVALSYRTNEWAKHLSHAEAPEPEALQVGQVVQEESPIVAAKEAPAPLDVDELQQTAESGVPAQTRSASIGDRGLSRANSRQSLQGPSAAKRADDVAAAAAALSGAGQSPQLSRQGSASGLRRTSTNVHIHPPISEEGREPVVQSSRRNSSAQQSVASQAYVSSPPTEPGPVPGVVSYSSPQTLLGQRENYLRQKSSTYLPATTSTPDLYAQRAASEAGSVHNLPMYASQPLTGYQDVDDLPLSQRKELIRHNSMMRTSSASAMGHYPMNPSHNNNNNLVQSPPMNRASVEVAPFDSHQPLRKPSLPTQAARQSKLAAFRQSVQNDLRSGTPVVPSGRESTTPMYASPHSQSAVNLSGASEVQRNIDAQRSMLLNQKEADARRREMEKQQREMNERTFTARMQSGDLLEAHRDVMRRMQSSATIKET